MELERPNREANYSSLSVYHSLRLICAPSYLHK